MYVSNDGDVDIREDGTLRKYAVLLPQEQCNVKTYQEHDVTQDPPCKVGRGTIYDSKQRELVLICDTHTCPVFPSPQNDIPKIRKSTEALPHLPLLRRRTL
jgi:hypothetical protein